MIRPCGKDDILRLYYIINEAARAYDGVIPADCYHQPYMPMAELEREMGRLTFYGYETDGELVAAAGLELIRDVSLIRHAYVLPEWQRRDIGSQLLHHLKSLVKTHELLVGAWADAHWAISFYRKHGFSLRTDKDELLRSYWEIPQRQIETSMVLELRLQ